MVDTLEQGSPTWCLRVPHHLQVRYDWKN